MADNVEKRRGRRGGWLVLALLVGVAGWVVRSRRAAAADIGNGWPTPRPAGAGAQYLLPSAPRASVPAPAAVATAQAAPAARRPSPRPRTPAATEPSSRER